MGAGNAGRSSAGAACTFNCWTISPASKRTFSFRRNSCAPVSHLHLMLSLSLWSSTFSWRLTPASDGSLNYFYPLVSKKKNQTRHLKHFSLECHQPVLTYSRNPPVLHIQIKVTLENFPAHVFKNSIIRILIFAHHWPPYCKALSYRCDFVDIVWKSELHLQLYPVNPI